MIAVGFNLKSDNDNALKSINLKFFEVNIDSVLKILA
jgi:hypothetical protein